MARYSLSALGADRPGIVAAVSAALMELGCNLEDSTMTILQGHFAILLVVAAPSPVGPGELERALAPVAAEFELTLAVRPLTEPAVGESGRGAPEAVAPGEPWTISVHGADRPGIVLAVSAALANAGGNVVDLATHLIGDPAAPVYVMTMRALLPAGADGEMAAEKILEAARDVDVHCTAHRDEAGLL